MATHTLRLHRVLRAPPERFYRAFLDADAFGMTQAGEFPIAERAARCVATAKTVA